MAAPYVQKPVGGLAIADTKTDTPIIAESSDTGKAWRNFQATAAIAGFTSWNTLDDNGKAIVIVSRWGRTRDFTSLEDAQRWLAQVSGARS